jgi:hypothetical protein
MKYSSGAFNRLRRRWRVAGPFFMEGRGPALLSRSIDPPSHASLAGHAYLCLLAMPSLY